MARPPAYRLYGELEATVYAGNKLQELIELGRLLQSKAGRSYSVKDLYGNAVWEGDNCGKIE